jgi:hypothetical protein
MRHIGFLLALILTIPGPANAKAGDESRDSDTANQSRDSDTANQSRDSDTADASQARYDGAAKLSAVTSLASSDGRFTLTAALNPAGPAAVNGRFALHAVLRPNAKAIALVCGADDLFRNGFEN